METLLRDRAMFLFSAHEYRPLTRGGFHGEHTSPAHTTTLERLGFIKPLLYSILNSSLMETSVPHIRNQVKFGSRTTCLYFLIFDSIVSRSSLTIFYVADCKHFSVTDCNNLLFCDWFLLSLFTLIGFSVNSVVVCLLA